MPKAAPPRVAMRDRIMVPLLYEVWLQLPTGRQLRRTTHYSNGSTGAVIQRYGSMRRALHDFHGGPRTTIMLRELDLVTGQYRNLAV
jgi:hypothetical protein